MLSTLLWLLPVQTKKSTRQRRQEEGILTNWTWWEPPWWGRAVTPTRVLLGQLKASPGLQTGRESALLGWKDHNAEQAQAWAVTPSIVLCFPSANCFLHRLPVYKPGCFCSSAVTLCRSTAQLLAKPLPATPTLQEQKHLRQLPKPCSKCSSLEPSTWHGTSHSKCWFPQVYARLHMSQNGCNQRTGKCEGRPEKDFCSEMGGKKIKMNLLSLMLAARCGCLGQR